MGRRGKRPTTPPAVPGGPRVASPTDAQVPRSYGREEEEGATEYKLSLCSAGSNRVKKLVTQCLYRLTEGHGRAVYRVGVEDDGTPKGLDRAELGASLRTLRCIARQNGAALNPCAVFEVSPGHFVAEVVVDVGCDADDASLDAWVGDGEFAPELAARPERSTKSARRASKFAAKREKWRTAATAEAEDDETEEDDDDDGSARRVAVIGSQGSGKSTLVGVLKSGMLDDGRGLARQLVLRHGHEGATVFAADVLVLAAPDGGLAAGFEAVVHADAVRQARLLFADGAGGAAAGSTRKCTFGPYHPEYLVPGTRLILRDGRTRAVGTVVSVDV
ncbi:GTPase [Aureococcus anophagefferens]|nr:GTPase [Aureococcus anophagefferens]